MTWELISARWWRTLWWFLRERNPLRNQDKDKRIERMSMICFYSMWGSKCSLSNRWWLILMDTMILKEILELVEKLKELEANLNQIFLLMQQSQLLRGSFLILRIQIFQLRRKSSLLIKALWNKASTIACWLQLLKTQQIQILLKASKIRYSSTKKLLFEPQLKGNQKDRSIKVYHKSENGNQITPIAIITV